MESSTLDTFFAPDGPLARVLEHYEERHEQREVARAVWRNLTRGDRLLVEAGTGSGKTFAYLLPALQSEARVVVSTATKTLQEQIVEKDVPLLERALGQRIDVQVMKGRANYLCLARTARFAAQPSLPGLAERRLFDRVLRWARTTDTGDRAELEFLPEGWSHWRELSATSEQCPARACPDYERCWVVAMRQRAQTAELVVVNHHLYLADLSLRARLGDGALAVLPPHGAVIFDEAHEIEETAAQHFGVQVSEARIAELGRDLARVAGPRGALVLSLATLDELGRSAALLFDAVGASGVGRPLTSATTSPEVRETHRRLDALLYDIESQLMALGDDETTHLGRRTALLAHDLGFVLAAAERPSLVAEAPTTELEPEPFVRYLEANGKHRALVARPLEVASRLQRGLGDLAAIFVSATLTVEGRFDYFRSRLGLEGADALAVDSPFDFATHAALYVASDLPGPDAPTYADEAAARAAELVHAARGGAFVLCTSHRMLPLVRRALLERGVDDVLVQGERPRSALLRQFAGDGDATLVATLSFWQGVDIPGHALRLVVIDRLPFASPGDPLVASRIEHLRQRGVEPFRAYQLPQAVLLLRQGFGRLIRTQRDRGLVAILDRRLTERSYGKSFLTSLPACRRLADLEAARRYLTDLVL